MSENDRKGMALRGTVLPPEHRGEIRMPQGTPFGLGIFGAAKFAAIRRVLEAYEAAARAKANLHDAEGEVANALTRREVAREQLRSIDTIVGDERNRIQHLYDRRLRDEEAALDQAGIDMLKRELERLELEDKIAAVKARREARKAADPAREKPDEYVEFLNTLARVPGLSDAAAKAKADITKKAGGEDNLSASDIDLMNAVDAMVQGFVSKQAESKIF